LELREKRWKKTLPESFKTFIKDNNGGIPESNMVVGNKWNIERFLCIVPKISESENGAFDIDAVITRYDEFMVFDGDSLGYDLIPFAQLNHDSLLCLCYDNSTPTIVIWQLEGSEEFKPNYSKCYDSFEDFISSY
ncbi:MAG: SMI1/KNR4 family protein, partial [Clostridiales bacterium]|nr:SMI1/KNR4 family protein [Clostridiales bacterium]